MEIQHLAYRSPHILTEDSQSLEENSYPVLRGSQNCDFSLLSPPLEMPTKPLLDMATISWRVCSTRGSSAQRLKKRGRQTSVYDRRCASPIAVLTNQASSVIAP